MTKFRNLPAKVGAAMRLAVVTFHLGCCLMAIAGPSAAQLHTGKNLRVDAAPTASWDTFSDTWVATDGLGRSLPTRTEAGLPRKDRFVGIFYFLWLGQIGDAGPYDITKILAADPAAMIKPDSPLWGAIYAPHHWGESIFSYYVSDDDAVLRKHAQMLADAGVDVVIFDVSNQITYPEQYRALLRVWGGMRAEGNRTPQVAFLAPFWNPSPVVRELWRDLYALGLSNDLWFSWEGKPLILADPGALEVGQEFTRQNIASEIRPNRTLAQRFTIQQSFRAVGGCFPTFETTNSGVTLKLFREGDTNAAPIAVRQFTRVTDNAWLTLEFKRPLPPGSYLLEASAPVGRIGWWSHTDDVQPDGQALADGQPVAGDRTLRLTILDEEAARICDFFTFRKPQPDCFQGPTQPDMWSWLEVHPQHAFTNAAGSVEEVAVGVAQNALDGKLSVLSNPHSRGRSFHDGHQPGPEGQDFTGRNFTEQWERAIALDPKLIFVTGWNEWIAGRFPKPSGFYGDGPVTFVDEFNREYSRDCEPMLGGHGDAFYWQLVANIRRFKGVRSIPPVQSKPIVIDGQFDDWAAVTPEFRDDIGDPVQRDHAGWGKGSRYVNKTGRNDLVAAKVSAEADKIYFYIRTREPLSPPSDPNWMLLFIDADNNSKTGWLGYDFVVRRYDARTHRAVLERNEGGSYRWNSPVEVDFRFAGNELELALPRTALGITPKQGVFDFKWADNIQQTGDWSDFTLNGDAAPNDRYNFRAVISSQKN